MQRRFMIFVLSLGMALICALNGAQAAQFNVPVPANAYITHNGADWAWAYPLPAGGGFDLSYQSTQGWRIPTAQELQFSPLATEFLFAGGNVPFNGADPATGATFALGTLNAAYNNDAAVAVPYFSADYIHADWHDGLGQLYGPWAGMPNAETFAEQLVIRGEIVPEPAALLLLAIGGCGTLLARRFRRR